MSRGRRIWYPGASYHVMSRGIRRSVICADQEDFNMFMMILKKTKEQMPFKLHSFCMMTNHLHMQLTTEDVEIGRIMKRILAAYARNFNCRYGYKGHLFESRYVSALIKNQTQFLEVSKYIHINPVKAGIVSRPEDYPYSSYRFYVSGSEHELLDKKPILDEFGADKAEGYRMFVEELTICNRS